MANNSNLNENYKSNVKTIKLIENSYYTGQFWQKNMRSQNALLILNSLSLFLGMLIFDISQEENYTFYSKITVLGLELNLFHLFLLLCSLVNLLIIIITFHYFSVKYSFEKLKNLCNNVSLFDYIFKSSEFYLSIMCSLFHPNIFFDWLKSEDGQPTLLELFEDDSQYTLNDLFCLLNIIRIILIYLYLIRKIPYNSDKAYRVWSVYKQNQWI